MEATVSSSMGAMGPVLRKLDLLLAPESRLRKRVKDGIALLTQDLEEVSSALVDLSMLETPSPRAKCWMEEARELSYQIEDFVDELMLMHTDAGAKIRAVSRHRVGRVKIALLPASPRCSTRVAKIAQLRDLLWQASERLQRYQLDACCSSPNHMNMITQNRWAPALYGDAANLVGIKASRMKMIEMLTGEAEQQLKVVSIVGPAGIGKTTLAKEIFRELRGQFELRAFVYASRNIDMRRLLGSILSQVQPHHQLPSVAGTVQSLIDSIQEQLRDKRYLIVIDDLWEETAWDIVRGVFPEGNNFSRIVATTENMNVALKCCSYMADNILKMKPLGIQDSGYLFFNRVFGSEQQCPDELKEVSYGIIRKCCGLPLSLIHVAGLLASIDYSELWYRVYDRLCPILNRSHTIEEIQKKILNLSYNSLPHCLKTCLLYFNMYPEGYIMWKVHLVKQWIAEGFINAIEGKDREEIAEGYFEELVNRGMVQPVQIDYNDEVLSCTVHHIVLDLIIHNSNEERFIAAIDYSETITRLSTKAHRLSFWFSSAKYAKQPARMTMSQWRSLGFFGFLKCMPPIAEFKHLRVLVLDFWGSHDGHLSLNLSRICILSQLRYLKISGDIMVELPAQMQGLRYLETLEIDARLPVVPLDIVHLPSLLHLGLRAPTELPDGIGHIRSLSTLLYFDLGCNSEDNIWSLSKLRNLQHLHLTCSAALSSDHLKRKLTPLVFSLGKFCNLKSLTLTPDGLRTFIFFDIWSGISSPPMFLQKLELLPPICLFYRLPTQIGELHKLCILKIVVKELQGKDISNISGLPSLAVFSLYVRTALTQTVVFSTMAFPALKYFKSTCGVMCLAFQAGAMPNLQRVKLCFNAHRGKNHNRVLDGIEHLLNLQEVVGRIGVLPGADESEWRVVKLSFEDIIRKHPRCPRFNSQLVDFIEEEYPPSDKFHLKLHGGSSSEHGIVEKAFAEDMDKHIDSRLSREFDLSPASGTSYHHKSGSAAADWDPEFESPLWPDQYVQGAKQGPNDNGWWPPQHHSSLLADSRLHRTSSSPQQQEQHNHNEPVLGPRPSPLLPIQQSSQQSSRTQAHMFGPQHPPKMMNRFDNFGMPEFSDPRTRSSMHHGKQGHHFPLLGSEFDIMKMSNGRSRFRSKYMSTEELESILRMQHAATHKNDPYIDDYYHQACLASRYVDGRWKHRFYPTLIRDPSSCERSKDEPHAYLKVDALGRLPFSSIRRPRPLLDVDDNSLISKPLDQEPLLAARITIEDGLNLLLDIDDIDRLLQFSQQQDGGLQLKNRRQSLLGQLAESLQLVDPLGPNKNTHLSANDDLVFLRIVSLPKGRKLLSRYINLMVPGSDLPRIVCTAVFRHLRFVFGNLPSDDGSAETVTKLASAVAACIRGMDLSGLSACLTAIVCSSDHPPLRPLGYAAGDGATVIIKSVLDTATELLNKQPGAPDYSAPNRALWEASFDAFFGLLNEYCVSKFDSMVHAMHNHPAAATAIRKELPVVLLRASLPHTNKPQRQLFLKFAHRTVLVTGLSFAGHSSEG